MVTSALINVFVPPDEARRRKEAASAIPDHWVDAQHSAFQNPWPSFRRPTAMEILSVHGLPARLSVDNLSPEMPHTSLPQFGARFLIDSPAIPKSIHAFIPMHKPTWGVSNGSGATQVGVAEQIKATWLGHACFLVELPTASTHSRGARILFDPVFSSRCSPSQLMGPKRFTGAFAFPA